MKREVRSATLMALFGFALLPGSLRAQWNFVYTNDDVPSVGANTVSGFSVASNGTLTPVPGSPFATRGIGIADGALSASNHVTVDKVGNSFLHLTLARTTSACSASMPVLGH